VTDRKALIEAFTEAWAERDLVGLMDLMSPECEFRSSTGPEPGATFRGREEVRRGFDIYLGPIGAPAAQTESTGELVGEEFAVTRWIARTPKPDGSTLEVRACDVFTFDGDRIKTKDTYRKVMGEVPRPEAAAPGLPGPP